MGLINILQPLIAISSINTLFQQLEDAGFITLTLKSFNISLRLKRLGLRDPFQVFVKFVIIIDDVQVTMLLYNTRIDRKLSLSLTHALTRLLTPHNIQVNNYSLHSTAEYK